MLSAVGERSEVDGVPVFWHQDPDTELYAELIIGCGERDETFRTRGVGRLIVALALSALPPLRLKLGSAVDRETLRFYAVGPPDLVTEFLEHLCRALADLPLYRLTREAGAVYAEWRTERLTTTAALLTQRYGLVGYGLEGWFGPGVDRIGPELVHEHAVRHLVRDNAVLVVGGAHRPGLRLPLPAGPRPPRSVQQPLPVAAGPKLLVADVNVGIGLRGGPVHDPTWELATTLLGRRIDRGARNERGLNVAIGMEVVAPGPDHAERILWCNAGDEHDSELASILWEAVTELAGNGPTAGELHSAFGVEMAVLDEPTAPMLETQRAAHAELFGLEFLPDREWLGTAADVTARDVGGAVATALESALVVVPGGTSVDVRWHGEPLPQPLRYVVGGRLPDGTVFRPGIAARARSRETRRLALVLTTDGVAVRDGDGDIFEVPFADVVGVAENGGFRTLYSRAGIEVHVDPDLYPGSADVVREIDRRVAAHLRFQVSMFGRDA